MYAETLYYNCLVIHYNPCIMYFYLKIIKMTFQGSAGTETPTAMLTLLGDRMHCIIYGCGTHDSYYTVGGATSEFISLTLSTHFSPVDTNYVRDRTQWQKDLLCIAVL